MEGRRIPFLGRQSLVDDKRASGRKKDLVDVELLVQLRSSCGSYGADSHRSRFI